MAEVPYIYTTFRGLSLLRYS